MNPKWTTNKIELSISFENYIMTFYDMFENMITPSSLFELIQILWNFVQRGLSIHMHEINAFYWNWPWYNNFATEHCPVTHFQNTA